MLQDLFERTYIVNLPEREDRRQEIREELKLIGSGLIPGKVEFFSAIKPLDYGAFPRREVLGCFLSHLHILKKAQADNLSNVLIVEDDLAISKRIREVIEYFPDLLKDLDWDILFLGFLPYRGLQFQDYYKEDIKGDFYCARSFTIKMTDKPVRGTHFYVVNQNTYAPLIEYLENLMEQRFKKTFSVPVSSSGSLDGAYLDTAYFLFRQKMPNARMFIVCPPLGWQRSSRSDVHPSRFDKVKHLSFFLRIYRNIKSVIKRHVEAVNPFFFSR